MTSALLILAGRFPIKLGMTGMFSMTRGAGITKRHNKLLIALVIPFGQSGYVALYRYDSADDAVYALAFRHQKEASY